MKAVVKREDTSEIIKREDDVSFWQRYFSFYDTLNQSIPYCEMVARHVELLGVGPGDRVLDAGTGTGNVAARLAAVGARVTGIDYVPSALEMCRRKVPDGDFRLADLTKPLDFAGGSFDKVTCCAVVHLLPPAAQAQVAAEFFRVLAPGGLVAAAVFRDGFNPRAVYVDTIRRHGHSHGVLSTLWFALRYSIASVRFFQYVAQIKKRDKQGDYHFFTREQIARWLEKGGFERVSVEPIFSNQCWIALGRKPA